MPFYVGSTIGELKKRKSEHKCGIYNTYAMSREARKKCSIMQLIKDSGQEVIIKAVFICEIRMAMFCEATSGKAPI